MRLDTVGAAPIFTPMSVMRSPSAPIASRSVFPPIRALPTAAGQGGRPRGQVGLTNKARRFPHHCAEGRERCASVHRNGYDFTARFPKIADAVASLPVRSCVMDGEAIVVDESGLSVFEALRYRLHDHAAILCAFDLIEIDGKESDGRDLRIERTRSPFSSAAPVTVSPSTSISTATQNDLPARMLPRVRRDRVETPRFGLPLAASTIGSRSRTRGRPPCNARRRRAGAAHPGKWFDDVAPLPSARDIKEYDRSCLIVRDNNGQALAYVYFETEPGRRTAANLLTPRRQHYRIHKRRGRHRRQVAQFVKEIAPRIKRAGFVFNPDTAAGGEKQYLASFEAAAGSLGIEPVAMHVRSDAEIETAVATLGAEQSGLVEFSPF